MRRANKYKLRKTSRRRPVRDIYPKIALVFLGIIVMASFYVYQRVWVRNLILEVEQLEEQNETAAMELHQIRQDWMAASSIANMEARIKDFRLRMRPTLPDQNLALEVLSDNDLGRYAGLMKALEKIKTHIPVVSPNEAGAKELFEDK